MSPLVSLEVFVAAVVVASAITLAVAAWLYPDAESLAARLVVYWAAIQSVVGLLVVGQVLAPTEDLSRTFFLFGSALGAVSPLLTVLFTLAYTGRNRWVSRRVVGAFGAWFLLLAGLTLTDPVLGLAYVEFVTFSEPFTHSAGMPTALFSLVSFPLWLLSLVPPVLLGARAMSDSGITRAQTLTLAAAFAIPFVVLALWMGQILPGPANGGLVVGSSLTAITIGVAVRRYHLFDLVPLAREMVYDELDDAVLVVDRDLRLLDSNRAAIETFPELEDAIGAQIDDLLPAVSDDNDREFPFVSSFTTYRGDEPRTYDVAVSYLPNEEQFQGYGLIVRDVTDQRRRMRDLEQQTTQLERFASTLSHDIRNPLHVAQGHLELALEDGENPSVEKANGAVGRIEQIVDDLLTLSREGRTIDDRQFVSLADVAAAAWETTRTDDATLDVTLDPNEGVYADETRLRNVFENLFRNALEFGGSDVTVTVGRSADGFSVEDDGPGVPPDQQEAVFEYEFTTTTEGTGLGLAIVESIARAHGWKVSVTDGADGGARFVFADADVVHGPPSVESGQSDPTPNATRE